MGMTIDEARTELISGNPYTNKFAEALVVAIDTIRKYQKIVQIMERTVDDETCMYDTLQEIEEVIEDGNDD